MEIIQKVFSARGNWSVLITRIIIGGIFIMSGYTKVSDMGQTVSGFSQINIPAVLAYAVSYGELVGGVFLALGLFTEFVSLSLMVIMTGAVYFTRASGFSGFGMPLVMLASLFAIFGYGPGNYTLIRLKPFFSKFLSKNSSELSS